MTREEAVKAVREIIEDLKDKKIEDLIDDLVLTTTFEECTVGDLDLDSLDVTELLLGLEEKLLILLPEQKIEDINWSGSGWDKVKISEIVDMVMEEVERDGWNP